MLSLRITGKYFFALYVVIEVSDGTAISEPMRIQFKLHYTLLN